MAKAPIIDIRQLSKTYQTGTGEVRALENVSVSVETGEIFGIIGVSGAGKSTLIRCMNLLEVPDTGSILFEGKDITQLRPAELRQVRSRVSMIFQHFNLLRQRTVRDNVAFPLELAGIPKKEIRARVDELLELVGLSDKAGVYPAQLSGGQKQRVAIARALANRPAVLLCDEATSALDAMTTRSILELLSDINRKLGLTIVLITHEIGVIKEICHQVAVIDQHRIVEQGPVIRLLAHPEYPATRRLVVHTEASEAIPESSPVSPEIRRFRIVFTGDSAHEPVISQLIRKYGLEANILFGQIEYIQGAPLGELVVGLDGTEAQIREGLAYLSSLSLTWEEVKGA